jgi:uncharacterized protein YgbK (DUF1537 family)
MEAAMTERWLIAADDLTGAADCAIAFAKHGTAASVGWGDHDGKPDDGAAVFSYDAASRELSPPAAAARMQDVLGRFLGDGTVFFKKIDSTLRGQPAMEILATVEVLRARTGTAFGIFAPAFPATGRTTRDGRVLIDGTPLEETEIWQRQHSYPSADLREILATAELTSGTLPLAVIRGGAETLRTALAALAGEGKAIAICDAETEDDLHRIAAASLPAAPGTFFIGSAGLAHALAAAAPGAGSEPMPLAKTSKGALIVVGSLARASRQAAHHLAETETVRYLPVAPELLLDDTAGRAELGLQVVSWLKAGDDVLVEILAGDRPDLSIGRSLADGLAEALKPAVLHMGGLAATGGDTAAALLDRFGVNGIRLVDEIEPGVSLGLTLGAVTLPVVTKAGGFGDRDSLIRIATRLRLIRQEGNLA